MPPNYGTRKPDRERGFDYRSPGPYFVTVCAQGRRCLFGSVAGTAMVLSNAGATIHDSWLAMSRQFQGVQFDDSVVIPNHFHALLTLPPNGADDLELGSIIQAFKRLSTNRYVTGVKEYGWPRFEGRLWQRSFHDHIVRDEREMELIRDYISTNPARWVEDSLYTAP